MNCDDNYVAMSFDEYLEHHGRKGMKWGIRRTPEQLGHIVSKKREQFEKYAEKSKLAGEAGKTRPYNRYKKKAEKSLSSERKANTKLEKALKRESEKAKKKAERAEAKKLKLNDKLEKALKKQTERDNKIVDHGTVDEVLAISDRLSDAQVNRAINRLQNRQRLESLKGEEAKKIDRLVNAAKKVADVSSSVYTISNNVRQFKKAMSDMQIDDAKKAEEERNKELNKVVKKGDFNKIWKVKDELSNTQMKEAYERLYLNNKEHVDRAIRENDEKMLNTYTHLLAYSPLYNKKSDKNKDNN